MTRWVGWAIAALFKPKAQLVAENLCLLQQLVVVGRKNPIWRFRLINSSDKLSL